MRPSLPALLGLTAVLAGLLAPNPGVAQPGNAGRPSAAVIPAPVLKGDPGNGPLLTDALRRTLAEAGCRVTPQGETARVVRLLAIDLRRPLSVQALAAVRAELGVDYVLYPRVLAVGRGPNSGEYQATLLLNVLARRTPGVFAHTRQIGQALPAPPEGGEPLLSEAAAREAARRLLSGSPLLPAR